MTCPNVLLVAVSQRVDVIDGRGETRDSLDQNIAVWLARSCCAAIPVPNGIDGGHVSELSVSRWLDAINPDIVLLSGGNNVGQFPCRDSTEKAMLVWAEEHSVPVLGICRGMQFMAVYAGAELIPVYGHVRAYHDLGKEWPGEVNSFHNFGFKDCPPGYQVLARASDGTIEAIRHENLPWEGWMWHPERGKHKLSDLEQFRKMIDVVHGR